VYLLYKRASTFGTRPSDLMGIQNHWLAYQFDEVVHLIGWQVESRLNATDDKGRRRYSYEEALRVPEPDRVSVSKLLARPGVRIKS